MNPLDKSPKERVPDVGGWKQLQQRLELLRVRHEKIKNENRVIGGSSYFDKVYNIIGTCRTILSSPYSIEKRSIVEAQLAGLIEYFDLVESDPELLRQEIGEGGELQLQAKALAENQARLYAKALRKLLGK